MKPLIKIALVAFVMACAQPLSASDSSEPVVLTIAGEMTSPNRGALDPFHDAFLMHKDKAFKKAFSFTRTSLAALPQSKIVTHVEGWPAKVELAGPRLADALAAAGVSADATIVATALDGYTVDLTPADRTTHDWILATSANGAPLSVGGRGPVWLIYGTKGAAVKQEVEATWVWALYVLEIK